MYFTHFFDNLFIIKRNKTETYETKKILNAYARFFQCLSFATLTTEVSKRKERISL